MYSESLTPELLRERFEDANARRSQALDDYRAATAELAWLRQGLKLLAVETDVQAFDPDPEGFPPLEFFVDSDTKPTVRQGIAAVLQQMPGSVLSVASIAEILRTYGWLDPEAAAKRVGDTASLMVNDGQVRRISRGIYALTPQMEAALQGFDRKLDRPATGS